MVLNPRLSYISASLLARCLLFWGNQSIARHRFAIIVLHWHFSSISNLWHVIRDFGTFKIGPEVVFAARWHSKTKMTSPFDSPIPILCRASVKIVLYLLPFESYSSVLIWLEIWHYGSKIWEFRVVLTPKCNFVSTRPSKFKSLA